MKDLKVLGIDLAKNIFQLHGNNAQGQKILSKRLKRRELLPYLSNIKPSLIGIEACGSAYYWAREFTALGHEVKIMAPKYVKPYMIANKNDMKDAEAIAEAVTRPRTRFIPLKSFEQQDIQSIHRARELFVKQRTAIANQIRGLLSEYGIVLAKGISHVRRGLSSIIEDGENQLTFQGRELINDLKLHFETVDAQIIRYDNKLIKIAKEEPRCKRLLSIDGIGPITATALVAAVGDAKVFLKSRHLAAFIGLVPKQRSSGDKIILQGISKKGNRYLRRLLIHGARTVMKYADKKTDKHSRWITEKKNRSNFNVTAVGLANKMARYAWAVLTKGEAYDTTYV